MGHSNLCDWNREWYKVNLWEIDIQDKGKQQQIPWLCWSVDDGDNADQGVTDLTGCVH